MTERQIPACAGNDARQYAPPNEPPVLRRQLRVLRDHIADETVDLIYLDPPFNSNASYNVLFKSPEGTGSGAQIEAFGDTWEWGEAASDAYREVVLHGQNSCIIEVKGGKVGADMVRSLKGAMDRTGAPMGILVTLNEPTQPMRETAASYDHWETDWGPVPRVQIITIRQLLESPVPPLRLPVVRHDTHRKAAREERAGGQGALDL